MPADAPREVRLLVPLDLSLARVFTGAGYDVKAGRPRRRRVDLIDTSDGRLAAAGGDLRRSPRAAWTWRRATLGHPKLAERVWTAGGAGATERVSSWTRAYALGGDLAARSAMRTFERSHTVTSRDSEPVLTIDEERLDERLEDTWVPRLRRLRVVVVASGKNGAEALDVAMAHSAPDVGAPLATLRPQLVRVPRLAVPRAGAVDARSLLHRSLTLSMIQWLHFDGELRGGSAPDAPRKMRVALRRIRSDLVTFRALIDRDWADGIRADLAIVAADIGHLRDAEVRLERVDALIERLPASDRTAAAAIHEAAAAELVDAGATLSSALDSDAYLGVLERAFAAVTAPRWVSTDDDAPPVRRLVRRPWRRLRRFVRELTDEPSPEDLHRTRILAKRARYAADAAVPAHGAVTAAAAGRLAELQTVLGEHHDAAVNRDWLHQRAVARPDLAFAAGQMAALEMLHVEAAAATWRHVWKAASRRRDWRWLRS